MKLKYFKNKFLALYIPGTLILSIIISGCSGSIQQKDQSLSSTGSDIMEGPGLFSGEKGAFYVVGGGKKAEAEAVGISSASKSVSNMDLNETSDVLDEKIKQLQREQIELELLKREINKKLKQ